MYPAVCSIVLSSTRAIREWSVTEKKSQYQRESTHKGKKLIQKGQGQRGGCTSPDVHGGNVPDSEIIYVPGNLLYGFIQYGSHKRMVGDREEIAVAAFGIAERDVNI